MAHIQASIRRAFLRQLWAEASANAVNLYACLLGFQKSIFTSVKKGQIIIGSSGGGFSTSLKTPEIADQLTQQELLALSEEYFDLYQNCISNLGASPTDEQVFQAMIGDASMEAVTQVMNDYTMTRLPQGYVGGAR